MMDFRALRKECLAEVPVHRKSNRQHPRVPGAPAHDALSRHSVHLLAWRRYILKVHKFVVPLTGSVHAGLAKQFSSKFC